MTLSCYAVSRIFINFLVSLSHCKLNLGKDNSKSMLQEKRREALTATIQRVAEIATLLSPDGISVRFLHEDPDNPNEQSDNLKTMIQIKYRVGGIVWIGGTPLGSVLNNKVVEPMILQKARTDQLKKPVIVVVITDGQVRVTTPFSTKLYDP